MENAKVIASLMVLSWTIAMGGIIAESKVFLEMGSLWLGITSTWAVIVLFNAKQTK